ncbi:MAG: hypothetical protein EU541_04785 [Promethearchaeota archaeon]|nr:MAG: hypothetical protein EU541_04785 [Candidatus Lokiarchaeota archaeon]
MDDISKEEYNKQFLRYIKGQRNQSKNYFAFSAEWIAITLTILTLLWSFGNRIPIVSYLLLIAFVFFVNNVAVNSKIIHEIDDGDLESLDDLVPWVSLAENTYSLGSTLVLTSFMIIFYSALGEDIIAPSIFLLITWVMLFVYKCIRRKVNQNKPISDTSKAKKRSTSIKPLLYMIEIVFLGLLWLDFFSIINWIGPLI